MKNPGAAKRFTSSADYFSGCRDWLRRRKVRMRFLFMKHPVPN